MIFKYTEKKLLELQGQVKDVNLPIRFKRLKKTIKTESNHYEFLYLIAKYYKPNIIAEIGTHQGVGSNFLLVGNKNAKIYTIDIDPESGKLLFPSIVHIIGDSVALSNQIPNNIELLFIDGNHTYEGVKRDFEIYLPKMAKGSLILIDDILSPTSGVYKFWDELNMNKINFDKIHLGYGFGGYLNE